MTLGFGFALALALAAAQCLVTAFPPLIRQSNPCNRYLSWYHQLLQLRLLLQSSYYRKLVREKLRGCVILPIPPSALVQGQRSEMGQVTIPVTSIYMRQLLYIITTSSPAKLARKKSNQSLQQTSHNIPKASQPAAKVPPSSPLTNHARPSPNRISSNIHHPPPTNPLLSLGARQTRLPRLVLPASLLPPAHHRKRTRALLRSHGHRKLQQHLHHQQHRPLAATCRDCWDLT